MDSPAVSVTATRNSDSSMTIRIEMPLGAIRAAIVIPSADFTSINALTSGLSFTGNYAENAGANFLPSGYVNSL